jgi:hypothetical protein
MPPRRRPRLVNEVTAVSAAEPLNLWLLVFQPDSLTYTLCRALQECGFTASVWVVDPDYGTQVQTQIQRRIAGTAGMQVAPRDPDLLPATIDRLIVQMFPRPADTVRDVPLLASRARAVTLITAGDRSRQWRDAIKAQWLEIKALGGSLRRIDRVIYKDGIHRRADLFALQRRRQVVGFDAHSQFLHDAALFAAIHARDWQPEHNRPILASFLGCQDPAPRKRILDSVRHLFLTPSGGAVSPRPGKTMFWHEYSDASPIGLPPAEFVAMLARSDFSLCPRGYSLVTHRPIEAMLRGSIPVLSRDELDLYGLDLADGHNCIAVEPGRWAEAIERVAALSERKIKTMREAIVAMRDTVLDYPLLARDICGRLGLTAPAARRQTLDVR